VAERILVLVDFLQILADYSDFDPEQVPALQIYLLEFVVHLLGHNSKEQMWSRYPQLEEIRIFYPNRSK
jgi:hypothetical protein